MDKELLEKLCKLYGPTGRETKVASFIIEEIKEYVDDIEVDVLGNVIAHKKGNGPKLMLAGHMDSIGFMATNISESGFIYVSSIGGNSPYASYTTRFIFENGVVGTMGVEKIDKISDFNLRKMYIDIGAKNKEDAEKMINIGDIGVFLADFIADDQKMISPALDDRVGCFIMIEALKKIKNPAFDLYFVFTVQEEIGVKGAITSSYAIDPVYGLAFDVTSSMDAPGEKRIPNAMHKGACIKLKDASVMCHPKVIDQLITCAEKENIMYQLEILEAGGTDAGAMKVSRGGTLVGGISIATRYIHSPSEMCAWDDLDACINLTVSFCETAIE